VCAFVLLYKWQDALSEIVTSAIYHHRFSSEISRNETGEELAFFPILMENGLWNRGGVQRHLTHISRVFLHNEHRVTSRHQLLEDCREIFRHLLKRQLNSLVLALVQVIDQVFDRLSHMMQTVTFVSENLNILQHNTQQAIIRSLKAYACFQRG